MTKVNWGHTKYNNTDRYARKGYIFCTDICVDTVYDWGRFSEQKYTEWQLTFYPTLTDDASDLAMIHTWCSDISMTPKTAEGIMAIGKLCKQFIVKDIFISSLFLSK